MCLSRKIEFKAKTIFGDRWVYGDFSHKGSGEGIITNPNTRDSWIIQLETVCQYIGVKDQKGEKIFENDIVESYLEKDKQSPIIKGIVNYYSKGATFGVKYEDEFGDMKFLPFSCTTIMARDLKIIGNVFDQKGE